MRVIKEGTIDKREYKFECSRCNCEFAADKNDKHVDQRDGDYVICPCCNAWIDWGMGELISK